MVRLLAFCVLLFPACDAVGAQAEIPLRVSLETLRDAFNAQLTGYRDGPCRYLRFEPASLESKDGRLHLAIPGRGALGVPFAGACQSAATWQGVMRFTLVPRIESGSVRIRLPSDGVGGVEAPPSVAGEFSEWRPVAMSLDGDEWILDVPLQTGVYRFSFVTAAGEWFVPERYPGRIQDGFGGWVALLVVP